MILSNPQSERINSKKRASRNRAMSGGDYDYFAILQLTFQRSGLKLELRAPEAANGIWTPEKR
jgi:hypothetical protein